jgi:hypothetical protein
MWKAKVFESENQVFGGLLRRVFGNVVRGFSLVLHDPEGSHYKVWERRI